MCLSPYFSKLSLRLLIFLWRDLHYEISVRDSFSDLRMRVPRKILIITNTMVVCDYLQIGFGKF